MKLDIQWIKRLRAAWLHPVADQIALQSSFDVDRLRPLTIGSRTNSRSSIRPSIFHIRPSSKLDRPTTDESTLTTMQNYSHQKFLDWRLFLNKTSVPQFQLYILPVRV